MGLMIRKVLSIIIRYIQKGGGTRFAVHSLEIMNHVPHNPVEMQTLNQCERETFPADYSRILLWIFIPC